MGTFKVFECYKNYDLFCIEKKDSSYQLVIETVEQYRER